MHEILIPMNTSKLPDLGGDFSMILRSLPFQGADTNILHSRMPAKK